MFREFELGPEARNFLRIITFFPRGVNRNNLGLGSHTRYPVFLASVYLVH